MKHSLKRRFSLLLAAVMAFGTVAFAATAHAAPAEEPAAAAAYGLPDKIEDGAILHCWCWDFNTIAENIPQIAAAGFKAVQTSPINAFQRGDNGGLSLMSNNNGKWWYQYQTTDYTIGNYMLGTEAEFEEMCDTAHKYGVKVVVDIVANHCSSDYSVISSHVKNIGGKAFHDRVEITESSNRYMVTQGKLTGLWDLNTQNPAVQQMICDYLVDVLSAGADGFRFDAAKHIELPDDASYNGIDFAGDFWPTVLDNEAEFQYGEILPGGDRAADYAKLMKITAAAYGTNLRTGIEKKKVTATAVKNYRLTGVDSKQLVTWVESHDNYCGDDASWKQLDNTQVQLGWALIAAQGDTTPLFFARPKGSSTTDQWGQNKIGIDGDGNYYSKAVAAVNQFRNAMVGESKAVTDLVRQTVTMIERGTKGAVITSVSAEDTTLTNKSTNLADGTYTDHVSGNVFTVANGKLSGTIKAGSVVVLYTPEEDPGDAVVGDIDGDGDVTIQDATLLQRHLAEFKKEDGSVIVDESNPAALKVADYDGNGRLTIDDVTAMQRYIAGY